MDLDTLNNLTDEQKTQYMRVERTFESDGWKDIERWAEQNAEQSAIRQLNASTWEQARVEHGMRLAFLMLANLRETTELEYQARAQQNLEEKQRVDETEFE